MMFRCETGFCVAKIGSGVTNLDRMKSRPKIQFSLVCPVSCFIGGKMPFP